MRNKPLAIAGSIAGALSAVLLTTAMPSLSSVASFSSCTPSSGPSTSRDLHWQGNDAVDIRVAGAVHFTAEPSWKAIATGPADVLKHLRFNKDGELALDASFDGCSHDVKIELTGPAVKHWSLRGSGDLVLEGLQQEALDLSLAGSGSVRASGNVQVTQASLKGSGDLNLDGLRQQRIELAVRGSGSARASGVAEHSQIIVYGSGTAQLGELQVKSASVRIRGSGDVFIAPIDSVDVQIDGSGNVNLLTNPKQIERRIHGSGDVRGGSRFTISFQSDL